MGLDVGTKRIGVAVSDESGTLAGGRCVVLRKSDKTALAEIGKIIEDLSISEVVVGMPVNMNGTSGPSARKAEVFGEKLSTASGVRVVYWDERLSTKEAEDILIAASVRRDKRKGLLDKIAAVIILQNYLDASKEKNTFD
jgi:putative holliday junction resolvase